MNSSQQSRKVHAISDKSCLNYVSCQFRIKWSSLFYKDPCNVRAFVNYGKSEQQVVYCELLIAKGPGKTRLKSDSGSDLHTFLHILVLVN